MFICNQGTKTVDKCLAIADELACAEEKYARLQITQIELLEEMKEGECVTECTM